MLSLPELLSYYPESLRVYPRFIVREYLQCKILQIIFDQAVFSSKLSFLGGTCLRLVHQNTRFSEDLDFDNFQLSEKDFVTISSVIANVLQKEGYQIEIKNVFKGAFHCYIRFPELLYQTGLSGYKEEKILIQLDTEPQHFNFVPERYILNKFDVFAEILTTPVDILLAQKFYAILNRKRPKGRDFFDVVFLLGKTRPNYDYLDAKVSINTSEELKTAILRRCQGIDMDAMAQDVAPFLFSAQDARKVRLFADYLKQVSL